MRAAARYVGSGTFRRRLYSVALQGLRCSRAYPTEPRRRPGGELLSPHLAAFSTITLSSEYEWIDGAEKLERYTKGGYHPTQIDDILNNRYQVVDKLGYGGWSTVWLAHDRWKREYVAIKIGVADSLPREAKILQSLTSSTGLDTPGSRAIPHILDEFRLESPNGSHPCFTTVPALCTLRQSSFSRLIPINVARAMAYELTLAVAYVHARGYVHGDIHLRNILVKAQANFNNLSIAQFRDEYGVPKSYPVRRKDGGYLPRGVPSTVTVALGSMGKKAQDYTIADAHIILSDFGESYAPDKEERLGQDCHTPVDFKPPEAHFKPSCPLSFSADVWSLATAIWDILGMQALFSSAFYSDDEVLCQVVDTIGPIPSEWQNKWQGQREFFDDKGAPKSDRYVWPKVEEAFEETVQRHRRKRCVGVFCDDESAAILHMMRRMLRYRPEERPSLEQVLKFEWMQRWARPEYERAQLERRRC